MDFDTVEILDKDVLTLIKLSDPTADKIIFTVFLVNIILTSFLIGYIPGHFYVWHTLVRSNVKKRSIDVGMVVVPSLVLLTLDHPLLAKVGNNQTNKYQC